VRDLDRLAQEPPGRSESSSSATSSAGNGRATNTSGCPGMWNHVAHNIDTVTFDDETVKNLI